MTRASVDVGKESAFPSTHVRSRRQIPAKDRGRGGEEGDREALAKERSQPPAAMRGISVIIISDADRSSRARDTREEMSEGDLSLPHFPLDDCPLKTAA